MYRVMQRVGILLILLNTPITGLAQNQEAVFSLEANEEPFIEVIKKLESLSGYTFSYSSNAIETSFPVTVSLSNVTLVDALNEILKETIIIYQVLGNRIILKANDRKQTVRGVIIDRQTRVPIIGATVMIEGTNPILGDASDNDGNFSIPNVPAGRHNIRARFLGYQDRVIPAVLVGSGKEVVINIELRESLIELGEITISGSGTSSEPINEMAQVSGRSFTVEETKRFPISIGDPLRLASSFAGVVSTDDGSNEIVIRGNTPRGILWRLEGVEIPNPNHFSSEGASSGGVSMFSTQVISRSDFFTGAFSPEYGNATSGVFDIHLRSGNNQRRETTIQAGLLGVNIASEGPLSSDKTASYLFNYRYSTLSILDGIGLQLMDEGEKNIFQDLSFKINVPTKKAGTFAVFGLGGLSSFQENRPSIVRQREDYNIGVIGVSNSHIINNSTFLKATMAVSTTKLVDDLQEFFPPTYEELNEFTKTFIRGTITLNKKFNSRNFLNTGVTISGLSYKYLTTFDTPGNPPPFQEFELFNDRGRSGSEQAFVSWKHQFNEKWSFVSGVHWLYFNLNRESVIEPRSSLKWQFRRDAAIFAGFGLHSRIESLEYYFGNFINPDGSSVDHNRELGLTKAAHYVFGFDKSFGQAVYFRTEFYYQRLFNVPVFANPNANSFSSLNLSDGFVTQPLINAGSGENYGVEIAIERTFNNGFYYLLNSTFYESTYKARDGITRNTRYDGSFAHNFLTGREFAVGANNRNNILGLSLKMSYAGNKRLTPVNLALSRAAGREIRRVEDTFTARFPDYFRMDLQISFRKNRRTATGEWRLDIQNLTSRNNVLEEFYDLATQTVIRPEEIGLIPILSYRVEF